MTILLAILIFTVIVLVHELGHFWAARRAGILVEEFSIGMGPRLVHFKRGDTIYSIKLFPIGGSCRMLGEDEGVTDPRSFNAKPVRWRILVIASGAIMNFVLAFIAATLISMFNADADGTVRYFTDISPAQEAGIEIGDRVVRLNNQNITIFGDFRLEMERADGNPMDLVVERNGERLNFTITPHYTGERYILGFIPGVVAGPFFARTQTDADGTEVYIDDFFWVHRAGFFESLANGYRNMVFSVRVVLFGLGRIITGNFNFNELMGPIGIVTAVGDGVEQSAEAGGGMAVLWTLLGFMSLLSANLGVINLLPLPALDGGRLIFLFLEAIRRKPINPDKEGMVHFIGFALLMILIVFVAFNDIMRLF